MWALYVILAGTLNAMVNYGYKAYAGTHAAYHMFAGVMAVTSALLFLYSTVILGNSAASLASPSVFGICLAMGLGTPLFFGLMIKAFAQAGPLSLVDPLWICIYSIVSVIIGMGLLQESPSLLSLLGIALYIAGAYFIGIKGRA